MRVFLVAFALFASPALAQIPNYQEQVQRAIESFNPRLSCPSPCAEQDDDAMKGRVLLRAAYFANQVDPSIGLLQKSGGSSIKGFSADVLMQRGTGHWADVLTTRCCDAAGGRYPVAQWDATVSSPADAGWAEWVARWRQPTAELAEIGSPPPPVTLPPPVVLPPPPPVGVPVITDDDVLERAIYALLQDHDRRAEAHWTEAKSAWESVKPLVTFLAKYVAPFIGGGITWAAIKGKP